MRNKNTFSDLSLKVASRIPCHHFLFLTANPSQLKAVPRAGRTLWIFLELKFLPKPNDNYGFYSHTNAQMYKSISKLF